MELGGVKVVGDLDVSMCRSDNLESEACACDLEQFQAEVARVGIVIVGLEVADAWKYSSPNSPTETCAACSFMGIPLAHHAPNRKGFSGANLRCRPSAA